MRRMRSCHRAAPAAAAATEKGTLTGRGLVAEGRAAVHAARGLRAQQVGVLPVGQPGQHLAPVLHTLPHLAVGDGVPARRGIAILSRATLLLISEPALFLTKAALYDTDHATRWRLPDAVPGSPCMTWVNPQLHALRQLTERQSALLHGAVGGWRACLPHMAYRDTLEACHPQRKRERAHLR